MPQFRVEASRPFETTRVDFAGPIAFKIATKKQGKCYILLLTCATSNAHPIEGKEDEEETSALNKRLREAKNHAWKRWRHEYVHSLMETHRITRKTAKVPDIGEIVLIVADEKNRGEWKKGKVVRHIRGKDGVVRGLSLLHKGHHIDRPLNLVCPLEIRQAVASDKGVPTAQSQPPERTRIRRQAAETAKEKIRQVIANEEDD